MDNSPLARLPAELRNRIYGLALPTQPVYVDDLRWANRGALLHTCHDIRVQTRIMFFADTDLYVMATFSGCKHDHLAAKLREVFGADVMDVAAKAKVEFGQGADAMFNMRSQCGLGCPLKKEVEAWIARKYDEIPETGDSAGDGGHGEHSRRPERLSALKSLARR